MVEWFGVTFCRHAQLFVCKLFSLSLYFPSVLFVHTCSCDILFSLLFLNLSLLLSQQGFEVVSGWAGTMQVCVFCCCLFFCFLLVCDSPCSTLFSHCQNQNENNTNVQPFCALFNWCLSTKGSQIVAVMFCCYQGHTKFRFKFTPFFFFKQTRFIKANKIHLNCIYPQAIQDVDEFVSSSQQIWEKFSITSLALQWMLCSEWVPSEWESKQLIKNITVIHTTPVHQWMKCWGKKLCL